MSQVLLGLLVLADDLTYASQQHSEVDARLRAIADGAGRDAKKLAIGLLGVKEIFGDDLSADPDFAAAVIEHLQSLFDKGAAAVVREMAGAGAAARLLG